MTENFKNWTRYFQINQENLLSIDWEDPYRLNSEEWLAIHRSLQQFQRGEYSEGKFLRKQAKRFFQGEDDHGYIEALTHLIREEQRHGLTLGRFMKQQAIPRIRSHWVDSIFRKMRRFAGLPGSLLVLTTAEIIAAVYYQGLKYATKSHILIQLCNQILWDEAQHLHFQACAFRMIEERRGTIFGQWTKLRIRILLAGTIPLVWWQHKSVLKRGGFQFSSFWRKCWNEERNIWQSQLREVKTREFEWNVEWVNQ